MKNKHIVTSLLIGFAVAASSFESTASATVQYLTFPVIGPSSYSNDFTAPRFNGQHRATDIIAAKHQKVISASNGTVQYVTWWSGAGYSIRILGTDGYTYNYYHLNNDTPGTDNGNGREMKAFAADMKPGNPVVKGQLIGYVGDSGNAETTVPHLHFEIYNGSTAVNPYTHLNRAYRKARPVEYPALPNEILPFRADSKVQVNIALGDFDDTPEDIEVVAGAGNGGGPKIKILKQNGTLVREFLAYEADFRGGVNVATGDTNGDGVAEIATGIGKTGGPVVKVFNKNGSQILAFTAYTTTMREGINVSLDDVDNDGISELITAPLGGAYPVRVFTLAGTLKQEFYPFGTSYVRGMDIATGDINDDGINDIVVGAGVGSRPRVSVMNAIGENIVMYDAYSTSYTGGVRVAVADTLPSSIGEEVIVAPLSSGGPSVHVYSSTGTRLTSEVYLEEWWRGGYDVSAYDTVIFASTGGNRRPSIRPVF